MGDIRKGKIKPAEVSDLQRKFKHELSNRKKGNKNTRNDCIIGNIKILFNAQEKVLKLYNDYTELKVSQKVDCFKEKESKY